MGIIGDRKFRAVKKTGLSLAVAASVLLAGCGGADGAGQQADLQEDSTEKERFQTEWKEQVSVWEGKWGPFDGNLKLGEDEWLALDAQDYLGVRGTLLIRDKDQALLLEDHVIGQQGIISDTQPQIMESWSGNGYRYGVYDLGKLGNGYSSMQMVIIVREKNGRRAGWRGKVFR